LGDAFYEQLNVVLIFPYAWLGRNKHTEGVARRDSYFYVKKARPFHPNIVCCNVCLASTILKPQPSMSRQPSLMKTLHNLIHVFEDVVRLGDIRRLTFKQYPSVVGSRYQQEVIIPMSIAEMRICKV